MVKFRAWSGFYVQNDEQHEMRLEEFGVGKDGKIRGQGEDDAGAFNFKGLANVHDDFSFKATKKYGGHKICYWGQCSEDRSKLEGNWGYNFNDAQATFELVAEGEEPKTTTLKEWEGHYVQNDEQHEMHLQQFGVTKEWEIKGHGDDDAGAWTFSGKVDTEDLSFKAVKQYEKHKICYWGKCSQNRD